MIIKNKKFRLSPSKGWDSLKLMEFSESLDLPKEGIPLTVEQVNNNTLVYVLTINNSLKATYINFPWYLKLFNLKYFKFLKNQSAFLLKNLNSAELPLLYWEVMELDGYKKKVVPVVEKESEPKSQKS
jgi:hypothetical protein